MKKNAGGICLFQILYAVHSREVHVFFISPPYTPLGFTPIQVGVGKDFEVHQADLKWLKSSLLCLSQRVKKAKQELLSLLTEGQSKRKEKECRKQRQQSSEAALCNAFQVETRSDN